MKIGFALLPENSFLKEIVKIENSLSNRFDFLTTLGTDNNLPHITLFQRNFNDNFDYKSTLVKITEKCKELGLTRLEFTDVIYVPEGWYFYKCRKTDKLSDLHQYTLKLVKDFLVLSPNRFKRDLNKLTKDQLCGLKDFGYRYSDNAYNPHITLARTKGEENREILDAFRRELKLIPDNPLIERATVYLIGLNGSHENTLEQVYLNE